MTVARRKQLCLDVTPYYHCVTRCVRQAFLCGHDKFTDRNFDHRRGWIEDHLLLLADVFCIELAAYSVMSNHYHVALKVDQHKASELSDDQVIERWTRLFKGPDIVKRYRNDEDLDTAGLTTLAETVAQWRDHMTNISSFMAHLNETIARRANKEDGCTGKFWESRFKMQAILDLPALLRTLCYVDLNPVRAKVAQTPETSQYTSIRRRVTLKKSNLVPFMTNHNHHKRKGAWFDQSIPVSFTEYLELLDWTGRQQRKGKPGVINSSEPSILQRLGFTAEHWMKAQSTQLKWKQKALGNAEAIKTYCDAIGQRWIWQEAF